MEMERFFRVLGDRNRLRMVLLLFNGPLNVSEISDVLGISQSNASHHLRSLLEIGLVERTGKGNWAFYRIRRDLPLVDSVISEAFRHRSMLPGFSDDMNRLGRRLAKRKDESREFFDSKDSEELMHISESIPDTSVCYPFMKKHFEGAGLLIDVGSGSGKMIPVLLGYGSRVLAVDSSRKMLDLASRTHGNIPGRTEFRLGEAEHLPVENDSADGILMHMLLHHCGDPAQALSEAARTLRKGGVAVVIELAEHRDNRFREMQGDLWPGFTMENLNRNLSGSGLKPLEGMTFSNGKVLAAAGEKGE